MELRLFAFCAHIFNSETSTSFGLDVDMLRSEVTGKWFFTPHSSHHEPSLMRDNELGVECESEKTEMRVFIPL